MPSSYKPDPPGTPNEAPVGQVWLCPACGKQAQNRTGPSDPSGWDESCYMHAVLVYKKSLMYEDGVLIKAEAVNDPLAEIVW